MINKFLKVIITFMFLLFLIGCGVSSNTDSSTGSSLIIKTQKSTLSSSKKEMALEFSIESNYANGIDVAIDLNEFDLNISSCQVENVNFSSDNILLTDTHRKESTEATILFSEECTPENYSLIGKVVLSLDGRTNEVDFASSVLKITLDENSSNDFDTNSSSENNSSDTINYNIKFTLEDKEAMKFNLKQKESFLLGLIDSDTSQYINNNQIDEIIITSQQPTLLKLFDANENSIASEKLRYEKKNHINIYMQTSTNSGLANIDVNIKYHNRKGTIEEIKKTYSLTILSGPPTAFSINSAGVSYNFETKWFEHKYLVSAVDKYNNIVNISPTIYVSAISGITRDTRGKELLYGKFGDVKGSMKSEDNIFSVNKPIFDNVDFNRDSLFIFGEVSQYEALGKWNIDLYSENKSSLTLSENYNGGEQDNLGFLVGHNYLNDVASSGSKEWQVKIDSTDKKYQLDEEGKTFITLKYPPYFIGKRIAFAVNFLGKTPETGKVLRSGEVEILTANNFNGVKTPEAITVDANSSTLKKVKVKFEIDTGTTDSYWVRNSHVSCDYEFKNLNIVNMSENKLSSSFEEFIANGETDVAYWSLELQSISETEDGTFTFKECNVRTLPKF